VGREENKADAWPVEYRPHRRNTDRRGEQVKEQWRIEESGDKAKKMETCGCHCAMCSHDCSGLLNSLSPLHI
jgi:hypothetical protein